LPSHWHTCRAHTVTLSKLQAELQAEHDKYREAIQQRDESIATLQQQLAAAVQHGASHAQEAVQSNEELAGRCDEYKGTIAQLEEELSQLKQQVSSMESSARGRDKQVQDLQNRVQLAEGRHLLAEEKASIAEERLQQWRALKDEHMQVVKGKGQHIEECFQVTRHSRPHAWSHAALTPAAVARMEARCSESGPGRQWCLRCQARVLGSRR
jgi:chromosome segregation ATPase